MQTPLTPVPDWFPWENAGASIAVADVDGDGRPDVVLLMVDAPPGPNAAYYRIGRALDGAGVITGGYTAWQPVPDWSSDENDAAGVAVADVDGDGTLDLVVFRLDAPDGPNQGWFRVGRSLDPASGTVTGGWTTWQQIPDWFPAANAGGDITVADVDGDGRLDLVVLMVDAPAGPNAAYYRSGPLNGDGTVTDWRPWQALPEWPFWENQGVGVAVADLDDDGHPELVVLAVDNPVGKNEAFLHVGWRLDERGRPRDGWGPWTKLDGWDFWENQGCGLAITPLGAAGEPHLVVLAVDAPVGQNAAFQCVLDAMTDLEMAPDMGVWRLLEDGSGTLAVHAALLHTGDVLFFAGSSNDPDRHNAHQFGTTVWRYPGTAQEQPDTPVDLFCVGHAFLPDGRLLAAGGTGQYDPFLGLTQSTAFDPETRTWVAQPDMAGGRWYPSLLTLGDGRVLATSGLDGTGQLNLVPEVFTPGAGWTPLPPSPHWPMYGHLFLLADGRVFYSGGQYGDNNGVRPAVWDLATNAAVDVPGLPVPRARNQSASVLLPPAQDQRVMIIGGGPADMHDMTGATASTAVVDLTATAPAYVPGPDLKMARMHLCATLLPDRTVLVNGGAMMEEMAGEAAFGAEILDPVAGEWRMAADSRVPRLYHSVAVLLPDGRVVTAGSNPQRKTEEMRVEVFWPPYLFAGPRPSVTPARQEVTYASTLRVTVPDPAAIASAALMRPVATTHSSDLEQRLVDLPVTVAGADALDLALPASPEIAPPGWYLLTVLDTAGVPSPAEWVRLS
jgi:galactose oxidase-like protein